jgi:hypothetical protein
MRIFLSATIAAAVALAPVAAMAAGHEGTAQQSEFSQSVKVEKSTPKRRQITRSEKGQTTGAAPNHMAPR